MFDGTTLMVMGVFLLISIVLAVKGV